MTKKQVTIYLDDEQLKQINADKGEFNKRITDLIQKGLEAEQGIDITNEKKALAYLKKSCAVLIDEYKKRNDVKEEPKPIKTIRGTEEKYTGVSERC